MSGDDSAVPGADSSARLQTPSLQALREVVDASGRLRRTVAKRAGLGESELVAMQHLMGGAQGPAAVARLLDVSTAASTGIVDRLVAHGHVERRPHADDRRRTDVHVTDSGREDVLALLRPMFVELARLDAEFSDAEREVVARYLRRAREALEEAARQSAEP